MKSKKKRKLENRAKEVFLRQTHREKETCRVGVRELINGERRRAPRGVS